MAISNSKQRMSLVIEKNDKTILENIAKENDRSVNKGIYQKEYIQQPSTGRIKIAALFAPYRACTALHDKKTVYVFKLRNMGLWRVFVGILKSGIT